MMRRGGLHTRRRAGPPRRILNGFGDAIPTDIAKKVGIGRASVYRILRAEQAHDIKMRDRLSRLDSRKPA